MPHRQPHAQGHGHRAKDRERAHWTSEFEKLQLPEEVMRGLHDADFTAMTPIQKEALPLTLAGRDLIGQAQTGTGKTAAFLISLYTHILRAGEEAGHAPRALVLAPTRELAIQIHHDSQNLGAHTGLRDGIFYGGQDYRKQQRSLEGGVDVAIGTPGRVLDFMRQGLLKVDRIRFLVIDEADRLLDMGFYEELTSILRRLPDKTRRQSMMFSATFDHRTRKIASQFMNKPEFVEVRPEHITAEGIVEKLYHVDRDWKFPLLLGLLRQEEVTKGLIFANMKITAAFIAEKLGKNGFRAELLTGDLPQNRRIKVLDDFRTGKTPLLVASDVASRGLHIDDVTHIINYDVPQDAEDYVHRIGRTARAGKTGVAYTLACDEYVFNLPAIEALLKRPIPFVHAEEADLGEDAAPELDLQTFRRRHRQAERGGPRRGGPPSRGGKGGSGGRRSGPPRRR